jgi:hypothetical protein
LGFDWLIDILKERWSNKSNNLNDKYNYLHLEGCHLSHI